MVPAGMARGREWVCLAMGLGPSPLDSVAPADQMPTNSTATIKVVTPNTYNHLSHQQAKLLSQKS